MEDLCQNLNERQKEAVLTTEGPVIVMAGAGSGKTRVLTRRIAHLILDKNVSPYAILAVTFTNKAAREMKERISSLVSMDSRNMWVSTFHSFCARFLRIEINHLEGYTTKFQIIDDDDSERIIREIMKELNIDSKQFRPQNLQSLISEEKNLGIEQKFRDHQMTDVYKRVFDSYQKKLKHDNLVDFDDLIILTLKILNEFEDVLNKYQRKFEYILVDEFQDTNTPQYELIKLLSLKNRNIFIVGDEDQSIYSFRGAKVENIQLFQKDFDDYKLILLEENYRSTKPILDIANRVIDNNKNRIKKNLFTSNTKDNKPIYYKAESSYDEEMFIVDQIKKLKLEGYEYKDFAIMYRSNFLSRGYEEEFIKYKIPYEIYGGISFFSRKEIKDICAYLRLIVNLNDDFSFERIVNEPKRKIGPAMISKLKDEGIAHNCSLFDSINYLNTSGNGYNSLIDFKFTIIELQEDLNNNEMEFIDIVDKILEKTGYKAMLKESGEEGQDRLDNIMELKSMLKDADEFYEGSRAEKLEQVLQDIALKTDMDDKDENTDAVKLMTYHQSKGLEFKVVFLVAMEEGIFPNMNAFSDKDREEERRICYVGITRAKEHLFLTSAKARYMFGHKEDHVPSEYISEIGLENLEIGGAIRRTIPVTPIKTVEQTSKVEQPKLVENDLAVGDVINHKLFGDGRVVEVKGKIVSIAFAAPVGIKKMLKDHPSIRKVEK